MTKIEIFTLVVVVLVLLAMVLLVIFSRDICSGGRF